MGYDNELLTEISRSGDSNYIRGVKRLRTLNLMRERSFLETKWELELSTKKSETIAFFEVVKGEKMCADQVNNREISDSGKRARH